MYTSEWGLRIVKGSISILFSLDSYYLITSKWLNHGIVNIYLKPVQIQKINKNLLPSQKCRSQIFLIITAIYLVWLFYFETLNVFGIGYCRKNLRKHSSKTKINKPLNYLYVKHATFYGFSAILKA